MLNAKYNLALEKGLEPFFHIGLTEGLPFDNIDLCSLFANLLDNAIEACEKVPDSQSRLLELRTRCSKGFFSFRRLIPTATRFAFPAVFTIPQKRSRADMALALPV